MSSNVLSNDLVLLLYGLIDFSTFLVARLVCQRWYLLSFERNDLRRFYTSKHLHFAYGPSSWHSAKKLTGFLLRNHELDANLASKEASIRSHHVFLLPEYSFCWVLGRYAFIVDDYDVLTCHDVLAAQAQVQAGAGAGDATELDAVLWSHQFDAETIFKVYHHRTIVALQNNDIPDEVGCSLISLVICDDFTLFLFELHIRRIGSSVQVTQTKHSEHRWIEDLHWLDHHPSEALIQGDWILFLNSVPFPLHTPTLRGYKLKGDGDRIRHRATVFAGPNFIASAMRVEGNEDDSLALFELPNPGAGSDACTPQVLPWKYWVQTPYQISSQRFLFLRLGSESQSSLEHPDTTLRFKFRVCTGFYLTSINVAISPDNTVSVYTFDSPPSTPEYLNHFEYMFGRHQLRMFVYARFRAQEEEKEHPPNSIVADENGRYCFGTPSVLKIPDELGCEIGYSGSDFLGFDELLGVLYLRTRHNDELEKKQLHVIRYI